MEMQAIEDLKKLRVVDLKERLSKLGKSTSGLKADLVARLHGALAEQAGNVDLGQHQSAMAGYSQVEELPELQPMNPEPPVVEVTIDTSQFECGVVEPQIVSIAQYPIVENVGEVTIPSLHMDQISEHDVDLYYQQQQQQQQQEEAERIQAMLHRQQQEEEIRRQQEEVERQRLLHEQILLQRQEEEAELQRQRELEEQQRLEDEERARWQSEEEFRRLQEVENMRREQEEQLLLAQEKAKEEERLRCLQLEEEKMRREQEEEMERARWQREEEFRQMQEAEMLRLKLEMEERIAREQQEAAERLRREQEEAERLRLEQEAERIRQEQEAERIRQEQEAERIRQEQAELIRRQKEEAELIRRQQEAERMRREHEEAERRRQEYEEAERIRREKEEAERLAREQEEAERIRQERDEAERKRREHENAERIRREQEEAERTRRELEEAERIRREQEEAERIRREQEEAERIRREQEEADRLRQAREETERIQREEERKKREHEEAERVRMEREEADRLKREQEEAERKRMELEKAERLKREQEEAEKRRLQQEEKLRKEQETAERLRKEREEAERLRRERERKKIEEEEERLKKKRLEEEEKERLHQEYLDKQTAAALIQIPVQVPVISGPPPTHEGMLYQPIMPGMGQPWPVSQPGFPPSMIIPPPVGMGEAPPGYSNVPHYHGEMSSPPHSSSPPPIPGLGPPSPSHGKSDLAKPPSLMSLDLHRPLEDGQDDDMRLPQALEKVLAYKMERAQMLGVDPDTIAAVEPVDEETAKEAEDDGVEMEDATATANKKQAAKSLEPKPSKNKQRKLKKKKRARHRRDIETIREITIDEETGEVEPDVEVQYIEDSLDLNPTDPMYHHFMKIFEAFKLTDPEIARREAEEEANRLKLEAKKEPDLRKKPKDADEDLEEEQSKKEEQPKLSKRKLKKLNRLSIAELKQHVNRPDVVEMHDVTAKDPRLLVILKSTRNTVPVPRHWCFKRKFLQGKRGIEKPPFDLPDFIKKTGIMEMRQALQEKEDQKTLKAKMRERVRPKMGKIDIDYQKLHDAFFKWQTKPKMTIHGDLYYEGKEFETRLKEKKPGELSDDLRTAMGMPVGPNSQKVPPPWLIAMQRYGPPPSYPNLKIPGLNSPIPDSCSFGYHAGGWGKPPVDEMGKPLYGDVFGMQGGDHQQSLPEEEVDRTLWGELESESESESEEEDEEEEEEEEDEMELDEMDKSGFVTPAEGGLVTPSGISSIPMGMETPDMIELRKRKIESEMEGGETPALYTILPEKKTDRLGSAMMGSTHIYDIAAAVPGRPRLGGFNAVEGGVDVALDPSELDLDAATMTARYEQTLREQQNQLEKEDLSDMVAEHSAKQKNKRKRAAGEQHTGRAVKKYKDFKF